MGLEVGTKAERQRERGHDFFLQQVDDAHFQCVYEYTGWNDKPSVAIPTLRASISTSTPSNSLTVSLETERVAVEPGSPVGSSLDTIGTVSTLAESTSLASSRSKSTALTVRMNTIGDPVDPRIVPNNHMRRVHHNDLIILHSRILIDPVRVEDTKIGKLASDLFFRHTLEVPLKLELGNTLMLGLTKHHTTMVLTLAASTADTTTDNDVSLLGLVTETVGLVGTGRAVATGNVVALTVLPSADAHQETEGVTLLVTPQLFHVLVGGHDGDLLQMND